MDKIKVFQGVDLIGGVARRTVFTKVSTNASYFVIFTVGVHPNGDRIVLDIFRTRGLTFTNQVEYIKKYRNYYKPSIIGVEDNNAQRWMVNHLIETTDCPVKGFTTTTNKYDPEAGIPALALEFENGKWILPYGDTKTRAKIDIFKEELGSWPISATTDVVMACWLCVQAINQIDKGKQKINRQKKYLDHALEHSKKPNLYERVAKGNWQEI